MISPTITESSARAMLSQWRDDFARQLENADDAIRVLREKRRQLQLQHNELQRFLDFGPGTLAQALRKRGWTIPDAASAASHAMGGL
jgi:hypothetical protein